MSTDFQTLKKAIARVTVEVSKHSLSYGTAFYVGDKYAITALHVVSDVTGESPKFFMDLPGDSPDSFPEGIKLEFTELNHTTCAKVVIWDKKHDWVVLECEDSPMATPIHCGIDPKEDDVWESFGYPEFKSTGMKIDGTLSDPHLKHDEDTVVLQLFCEQAAAGVGTTLHGLSGAPCLIDGKAVGLLRYQLLEELPDGRLQPKLFTKAGTVFACRSKDIVERESDLRKIVLPNGWSPSIVADDFVVILSQEEKKAKLTLKSVVKTAYSDFLKDLKLAEPDFRFAEQMISSEQEFKQAVRMLCRARVVIFDATGFEPAVMVLMGIRAVVRRGVTILSVGCVGGEDYVLGKPLDLPFNITDANIVAHSQEQNRSGPTSVRLLTTRVRRSMKEIDSPYYLDLPVFDAIRKLPEARRGIRARQEGVLVLCSFDPDYTKHNWKDRIQQGLQNQLDRFRVDKPSSPEELGVARSLELNSPRLVTQAVYEEIRRAQACIVDLTGWSPSVLFELGVRLAASKDPTVCMIAKNSPYPHEKINWKDQCEKLALLFDKERKYQYDPEVSFEDEDAYKNAYGPDSRPPLGPASGSIHKLIERELDMDAEPVSRTVYRELLDSAELFARVPGPGGETKPVGLFPGNDELTRREEVADFERLAAAWYYLYHRYSEEQILGENDIRTAVNDTIEELLSRHAAGGTEKLDDVPDLFKALKEMRRKIRDWEENHAGRTT